MDVFVAGGTGFVGRSVCRTLLERGHDVTAASRSPDPSVLPAGAATAALDVEADDPTDVVAGHDALVNLVALPSHRQSRGRSHERVHLDGTRALVDAAGATGVTTFVQLSALGAGRGHEVQYFRAKDRAERVVRESGIESVIARPSVVFGEGAGLERFLRRVTPPLVAPVPAANALRVQPIWVEDLAAMLAEAATGSGHAGATYELGGPEQLWFGELVRLLCGLRVVVPVPGLLARAGFTLADALPWVPVGRDQYRLLHQDNTTADNDVATLGVVESELATVREYVDGSVDGGGGDGRVGGASDSEVAA